MSILGPSGKPLPPGGNSAPHPAPGSVQFAVERVEFGTVQVGQVMQYRVHGRQGVLFVIAASRIGVEIEGHMPALQASGMTMLMRVMRRAIRQHEMLASTKVGEPQQMLSEDEMDAMEKADAMNQPPAVVRRFPTAAAAGSLPHAKGV